MSNKITISVEGFKISVEDNKPYQFDYNKEFEKVTESYVEMIAENSMSEESFLHTVGKSLKKALDSIVKLFKKIIDYIASFFQSQIYKISASKVLKDYETKFPSQKDKNDLSREYHNIMNNISDKTFANAKIAEIFNKYIDTVKETKEECPEAYEGCKWMDNEVLDLDKEKRGSTLSGVLLTYPSLRILLRRLNEIKSGTFKKLTELKKIKRSSENTIKEIEKSNNKYDNNYMKIIKYESKLFYASTNVDIQMVSYPILVMRYILSSYKNKDNDQKKTVV